MTDKIDEQIRKLNPAQRKRLDNIIEKRRALTESLRDWFVSQNIEPGEAGDIMKQFQANMSFGNTRSISEGDTEIAEWAEWMREVTRRLRKTHLEIN
jgi:hypothetical protein